MAELKTKQHDGDVVAFLNAVKEEEKKAGCMTLLALMKKITGQPPKMWGGSIVGFGSYHYKSERSKQQGDWFITGFSPRKQNLTIYIMPGFERYNELMAQLGKYKTGVSCLYINKLADVDIKVLEQLVKESYRYMKEKFSGQ